MLGSNETPKVELNQLGFISELGISHVREDGSLNETQVPLAKENGGGLFWSPPILPVSEEGFLVCGCGDDQTHDTCLWADETDSSC